MTGLGSVCLEIEAVVLGLFVDQMQKRLFQGQFVSRRVAYVNDGVAIVTNHHALFGIDFVGQGQQLAAAFG